MKLPSILAAALLVATVGAQTPAPSDYPIQPVPMSQVKVTGGFWQAKLETNRTVTIPHILEQNEKTGRVDNLRKGAGLMPGDYQGRRFNDTDIYKIVEAASYSLISHPDPTLAKQLDALIAIIAKAQQPDGYLFPARTINPDKPAPGVGTERWQYENTGSHELYNSGHMYEAAVAHYQATGDRAFLDVAIKNANLVATTFGPDARKDAPGHEEVELALVKLYRATKDPRYLNLAKFFLDERGIHGNVSQNYTEQSWQLYNDRPYRQDDIPLVDQPRAQGHAVRGTYVYNAMTDIAAMLKDPKYNLAVDRLWNDVMSKRVYLTGGLGSVGGTEAFGDDYALPNRTAYTETCASVGGILWYHRMFLKSGDAKYLDAFEQTLYNGLLSGVSVKGDTFFYQNPLESAGRNERSAYFDVACCPANLSRLLAQLPGLIYSTDGNQVFVNLYVSSEADLVVKGAKVHISQTTNYPWDGRVQLRVTADKAVTFPLKLRVPGWLGAGVFASDLYTYSSVVSEPIQVGKFDAMGSARPGQGWTEVSIPITAAAASGSAAVPVHLNLPMPVRRVTANPGVKDDVGKAAIQRGPIVYALEAVDNGGRVLDVAMPGDTTFTPAFKSDLLGGVTVLTATLPATDAAPARTITAIPYFAWANRGRGEMVVWIKQ
ncbi:MAG TPA: beta-L-arabinofuranosidase domain-containing protein [Vicinamibacterales bacterium]|nr:beta-L-arabinofuranosidase domain-containing protein [Vicinamibacterales bacterium]